MSVPYINKPARQQVNGAIEARARRSLRAHWKRYSVEGATMVLVGAVLAVLPAIGTFVTVVLIGWILFASGLFGILAALSARRGPGHWHAFVLSLLVGIVGLLIALQPLAGELSLTMVMIAYFMAHGLGMAAMAYELRAQTRHWPWLLGSAVVDFLLVGLVLIGWPQTATWFLGLVLGLNLGFAGLGLVLAAVGAHLDR